MSLTDVAAKMTIGIRIFVHDIESIATCVKRNVWFPGKGTSERRMSTCSPLAVAPPVILVGGGIVTANAYMDLDARNS